MIFFVPEQAESQKSIFSNAFLCKHAGLSITASLRIATIIHVFFYSCFRVMVSKIFFPT